MTNLVSVLGDRGRLGDTVQYVLQEAREDPQYGPLAVRFLIPVGRGGDCLPLAAAETLGARVETITSTEATGWFDVKTELVSVSGSTVEARADALLTAVPVDASRIVLMPELVEFDPTVVESALARRGGRATPVERAPVGRRIVRPPLALSRTAPRAILTFGLSFGFYLTLGDPTKAFDVVTGVLSAGLVAAVLSRVAFETDPSTRTVASALRAGLFLPYLLYAVVRANLAMAVVVLDPRLPIDPSVVRVPAPTSRVGRALLANSITLTPGTLTVDVVGDALVVHTLTMATRADLETGRLARAVGFVVGDSTATKGGDSGGALQ
jgi:multicomponent Na+:H+ antiporter subunit E